MLGTKIILQFVLDNSINAVSFITTIILARLYGPEVLGLLGFILAVIGMIAFVGDLGFTQAHIKKVSEGYDLGRANGAFFLIKLILGSLIFIFSVSYLFLGKHFGNFAIPKQTEIVFIIMLAGFLLSYFGQSILYTFQARQEVVKSNLGLFLGRLTKLAVIIISAILLFQINAIAFAFFLEGLVIFVVAVLLLKSYPVSFPKVRDLKTYVNFALPFLIWIPLANFSGNIDRVLLKNFWGVEEVGLFFAVQSLIFLPQSFSTAAMNLFFPQASFLSKQGKLAELQNYTNLIVKYLTLIVVPLVVFIMIFAKELTILILGEDFVKAFIILQVFAFAILVLTISRPYSYVLLGSGKHHLVPFVNSFVLILMFILEVIFIPKEIFGFRLFGLGAVGPALASLMAWSCGLIIFVYLNQKFLKIQFYYSLLKQLFAGFLMFGFLQLLITQFLVTNNIIFILPFGFLGLSLFLVVLFVFGEITVNDFIYLKELLKPSSFKTTIQQEWQKEI